LSYPGYRLIRENYSARTGEIDLVFEWRRPGGRGCELVFVEVKARRGWRNGLESVDWVKRRRLAWTAKRFLASYRGPARTVRFDVIAWERGEWSWIRDAWREDEKRGRSRSGSP